MFRPRGRIVPRVGDRAADAGSGSIDGELDRVSKKEIVNGRLIENVEVASTFYVEHKLGRIPRGAIPVRWDERSLAIWIESWDSKRIYFASERCCEVPQFIEVSGYFTTADASPWYSWNGTNIRAFATDSNGNYVVECGGAASAVTSMAGGFAQFNFTTPGDSVGIAAWQGPVGIFNSLFSVLTTSAGTPARILGKTVYFHTWWHNPDYGVALSEQTLDLWVF